MSRVWRQEGKPWLVLMRTTIKFFSLLVLLLTSSLVWAQGVQPYPNAITNRLLYPKTPMTPPAVNSVFVDPDLGASLLRATDEYTDPTKPDTYFHNPPQDSSEWSMDNSRFYVVSGHNNGILAFAFDPATMTLGALPGAGAGGGLAVPLRAEATFSFVDPDLMYGTLPKKPFTIATYRFSTGQTSRFSMRQPAPRSRRWCLVKELPEATSPFRMTTVASISLPEATESATVRS